MNLTLLSIRNVLKQHAGDAAWRWQTRRRFARHPDCRLVDLAERDDNINANLDGLLVAGSPGWDMALSLLERERDEGEAFVALALGLLTESEPWITQLVKLVLPAPECHRGLVGALAWIDSPFVQNLRLHWLTVPNQTLRYLALSACAHVRYDPGPALLPLLSDMDPQVRARAARAAGELGRRDLLPTLLALQADPACTFWAAWSAVLLGERQQSLTKLDQLVRSSQPPHDRPDWRALELLMSVQDPITAHSLLQELMQQPDKTRYVIKGCGFSGNPAYVPWLLGQLAIPSLAQTAVAALAHITGLDLKRAGLDGLRRTLPVEQQQQLDASPEADWPWPDAEAVKAGWPEQAERFPIGQRHVFGLPQSDPIDSNTLAPRLMATAQAERARVATLLCITQPGCLLFPVHAPASAQYRLFRQAIGEA